MIGCADARGCVGEELGGKALAFGDTLDLHGNCVHRIAEMIQPLLDPGLSSGIARDYPFPAILDPFESNSRSGDYQDKAERCRSDDFKYRDYLGSLHLIDR